MACKDIIKDDFNIRNQPYLIKTFSSVPNFKAGDVLKVHAVDVFSDFSVADSTDTAEYSYILTSDDITTLLTSTDKNSCYNDSPISNWIGTSVNSLNRNTGLIDIQFWYCPSKLTLICLVAGSNSQNNHYYYIDTTYPIEYVPNISSTVSLDPKTSSKVNISNNKLTIDLSDLGLESGKEYTIDISDSIKAKSNGSSISSFKYTFKVI